MRIIDRLYDNTYDSAEQHKNYIKDGEGTMGKAHRLLSIVRRRSFTDYKRLSDALRTEGQPRLAQFLEDGKGKSNEYKPLQVL